MREAIEGLRSRLANQVTRARLVLSSYSKNGQRTLLQVTGLSGEIHQDVELLLPYGMSARPVGKTADLLIFQVNATRDHKVAIGCDDPALRIPDLAAGEWGFRDAIGQQLVFRKDRIEVTSPTKDIAIKASQGNVNIEATAAKVAVKAPHIELSNGGTMQAVKLADGSNSTIVKAQ